MSDLISELVAEIGPGKSAKQLVERNAQRINEVLESYIKKDPALRRQPRMLQQKRPQI